MRATCRERPDHFVPEGGSRAVSRAEVALVLQERRHRDVVSALDGHVQRRPAAHVKLICGGRRFSALGVAEWQHLPVTVAVLGLALRSNSRRTTCRRHRVNTLAPQPSHRVDLDVAIATREHQRSCLLFVHSADIWQKECSDDARRMFAVLTGREQSRAHGTHLL